LRSGTLLAGTAPLLLLQKLLLQNLVKLGLKGGVLLNQCLLVLDELLQLFLVELVDELLVIDWHLLLLEA
jgi:hypothetical protein